MPDDLCRLRLPRPSRGRRRAPQRRLDPSAPAPARRRGGAAGVPGRAVAAVADVPLLLRRDRPERRRASGLRRRLRRSLRRRGGRRGRHARRARHVRPRGRRRRGRLRRRRFAAGRGDRHDDAGPPRRRGARRRHRALRRRRAAREPPHDRRVPRERVHPRDPLRARRADLHDADRAGRRRAGALRRARRDRRGRRGRVTCSRRSRSRSSARRRGPDRSAGRSSPTCWRTGFKGAVHAVNPRGGTVQGLTAVRSVADVPGDLDLAVVAVPAASVLGVARECAARGVHALVVVSAGFGGDRRGGARPPARAADDLPRGRDAPGRPQLPRAS